jgi:hypothetical protein
MARVAKRIPADPTYYPTSDNMGESTLHRVIVALLHALVIDWCSAKKKRVFVGADQFIYFRQHAPTIAVAPDVYILPGVAPDAHFASWKIWERDGIAPSFAFECVSDDWLKDHRDGPPKYDEIGTAELVIYDPGYRDAPSERLRWQVWRRVGKRGLVRVEGTNGDRVKSKQLGCWLRVVGEHVRLATGEHGETIVPSVAELAESANERAANAEQRAASAERELEALRAKLSR